MTIIERLLKGETLMACEWRGVKVETVSLADTKSGRQRKSVVARHSVEAGVDQVSVTEWMPDGTEAASVKFPYSKGDRLLLVVRSKEAKNGLFTATGVFEPMPKA